MKILIIAPVPPPVTGNSLAVKVMLDDLRCTNDVTVINLSKSSFKNGIDSFERIAQIFRLLKSVCKHRNEVDIIYFTISESIAGNLKDILIYLICFRRLDRMVVHLHGGAGMDRIMKHKLLYWINKYFVKRLGAVIVLGKSHLKIFSKAIAEDKIKIVANFAEEYLFIDEKHIYSKFARVEPIRILFLSNLIEGKGHIELVDAYESLSEVHKGNMEIHFAGGFESKISEEKFLKTLNHSNLRYHGVVSGRDKEALLAKAHVFCLPTYYPYEGQPISILEAYASGCVVITTNHSGIVDVFEDQKNGFAVAKRSVISLRDALMHVIVHRESLLPIALCNRQYADQSFRLTRYNKELDDILAEANRSSMLV